MALAPAPHRRVYVGDRRRTLARFEEERAYLFGMGVPAEFLPIAREFGRLDLLQPADVS